MKVYLIGSLKNRRIPVLGVRLRTLGHTVFDDWHGTGPDADDHWMAYEKLRGRTYKEAVGGHAARNIFEFDRHHIDQSDCVVLVMPAGKSGHLELGYAVGKGKRGYILFYEEPDRYEVMHNFATGIAFTEEELIGMLNV